MTTIFQQYDEAVNVFFKEIVEAYEHALNLVRQGADPNQSLARIVERAPASLRADASMLEVTITLHKTLAQNSATKSDANALLVARVTELLSLGASLLPRPNQPRHMMCLAIASITDRSTLLNVLDIFYQAGLRCDPQAITNHVRQLLDAANHPEGKKSTFKMHLDWINPIVACVVNPNLSNPEELIDILQQRYGASLKDADDNIREDDVSPSQKAILVKLLAQQERAWLTANLSSTPPPRGPRKM